MAFRNCTAKVNLTKIPALCTRSFIKGKLLSLAPFLFLLLLKTDASMVFDLCPYIDGTNV